MTWIYECEDCDADWEDDDDEIAIDPMECPYCGGDAHPYEKEIE